MSNNVHPEILDGLEYETQYIQKTSGAQRREVKLNRGDSWLVRFLPVKLGPNKRFYARIAKHWINNIPIVCPRETEEAYGGSPESYCPVCDLAAHLNADRNEDVSNFGYKIRATPQWTTFCAVFQKALNGGNPQDMSMPEILLPYTFQHYKSTWEELVGFIKQNARRAPESVLDLEKGNDFYISRGAKGMRLDKQDTAPIFDLADAKWDENVQKLFSACKEPVVKMPTEKKLDEYAAKAEENVLKITGGSNGAARGRGRPATAEDTDDLPPDDDQAAEPAAARRRSAPAAEEPAQPVPTRRAAPAQEAATPAPTRRAAPAATEPTAAPTRRAPAQTTAAPTRRAAAPPAEPADDVPADEPLADQAEEPQAEEPPPRQRPAARQPVTPPPAPSRRTTSATPARNGGGAPAQESIDEEEMVAEEANDQAPPEPLVDAADDTGAAEEPPAVESRRGSPSLGSKIQTRVAAVTASAKK